MFTIGDCHQQHNNMPGFLSLSLSIACKIGSAIMEQYGIRQILLPLYFKEAY
jgi:hypothetical protein